MNQTLKQRIVGAGILLGFGAVLVPWLLDAPQQTASMAVPSIAPSPVVQTARTPTIMSPGPGPLNRGPESGSPTKVAIPSAAKHDVAAPEPTRVPERSDRSPKATEPARPAQHLQPEQSPKPTHKGSPGTGAIAIVPTSVNRADTNDKSASPVGVATDTNAKNLSPPVHGKAWMVQLGTFKDERNAQKLESGLKARGFVATVAKTGKASTTVYRVQVGPVYSEAAAQALRGKLTLATGIKGVITER